MAKDLFSGGAGLYARYRPSYPDALISFILSHVAERDSAWDCATGNGQAAVLLAPHFREVAASDSSKRQLQQAKLLPNIRYYHCPAEATPFPDGQFSLITVAQAYHWLHADRFRKEAQRTGRRGCVVAVWMYDLPQTDDPELNEAIRHFYSGVVGPYWEKERRHVERGYRDLPFDYTPISAPPFTTILSWNREDLAGYLGSWSATLAYQRAEGRSPLEEWMPLLQRLWPEKAPRSFSFPITLKLGRLPK